jgi:hypothetical protein
MKKLFFALLLLPFFAHAQLPVKDGKVFYAEVINIDSADKSELYSRARKWFEHEYIAPKNVIQVEDKENGEMIGRGLFEFPVLSNQASVYYVINVAVKDNKYKYEVSSFSTLLLDKKFEPMDYPKLWGSKKKFYSRLDTSVQQLITSLKESMLKRNADNW